MRILTGSLNSRLVILENERQTSVTEQPDAIIQEKKYIYAGNHTYTNAIYGKNSELLNFPAGTTHSNN